MAPQTQEERTRSLRMKRTSFKFEILMFKQFVDKCDPVAQDIEIQNRLSELATEYASFMKNQSELDASDETGQSMKERIELKNSYLSCTSHAQKLLQSVQTASNTTRTPDGNTNGTPVSMDPYDDISLPKLRLPSFGGRYEDWPGFADQFKSAVHDNVRLNDCKKLLHLRSCLHGEAALLIQSLENAAANYIPAWNLLESRYNKPSVIVANHVRALFNLPQLTRVNHHNLRTFLTELESHYRALTTLDQPSADTLLIHLCLSRLDQETNLKWKEHTRNNVFPKLDELLQFLHNRCHDIEPSSLSYSLRRPDLSPKLRPQNQFTPHLVSHNNTSPRRVHAIANPACPECKGQHAIFACNDFVDATVPQRAKIVAFHQLCANCLRKGHTTASCRMHGCRVCKGKHHTLLHTDSSSESQPSTSRVNVACMNEAPNTHVILSTAVVNIIDGNGQPHRCRILLDSCAQSHFLTRRFAEKLRLPIYKTQIPVVGMNHMHSNITNFAKARLRSRTTNFGAELTFLLANRITEPLPDVNIDPKSLQLPRNIQLADPDFHKTSEIDGLLGAQLFWHLLSVGQIQLAHPTILLRKTLLGWLVVGEHSGTIKPKSTICNLALSKLNDQLIKFWEVEETPQRKLLSKEEMACERHYVDHTRRDSHGRYTVKLPFKDSSTRLGNSYNIAMKRFIALEKSFKRDTSMREKYVDFMREYINLGHMSRIKSDSNQNGYFLPHHAVYKQDSLTTKIRVVFDASAKTTSGVALNDILMTGPTIQDDLFSIVIRFRTHKYVLTADIAKMYRQVNLSAEDRPYHKILWRENAAQAISAYTLNTVTYGTASASYLAIRSMHQLADDEGEQYPIAARILKSDFYVDDLLTGAETFEDALAIRDQLRQLLDKGGLELRQWASNDPRLINSLTVDNENVTLNIITDECRKTLGLQWNQVNDTLGYTVKTHEPLRQVTKRTILSRIAQLFDPLGLLGPIIVKAKILMQQLWKLRINWDESIPETLHTEWKQFESQLKDITNISVPRRTVCEQYKSIELHGFCDASERAYGTCIYLKSVDPQDQYFTQLVCSKSRVTPLKIQSLPRLELCAAVLLVKLFNAVKGSLKLKINAQYFWTDSMIALHWINTPPHTLKTFVANRVSEIQETTNKEQWRHVPSQDNPADCLSRGIETRELAQNKSWFSGPQWFRHAEVSWPVTPLLHAELPESRPLVSLATVIPTVSNGSFINQFSSLGRLERVTAYCLRFHHNIRRQQKLTGSLTANELQTARRRLTKFVQSSEFGETIKQLADAKLTYKGKLRPLNPFIDEHGILRVGGRITRAESTYDKKHPILLPAKHHYTAMIIRDTHWRHYHAGVLGTLNAVRQTYWPINALQSVKETLRTCVPCYRANPKIPNYQMGDLPKNLVTLNRPFLVTGIDYCGPFHIKEKRLRNTKTVKAYVSVFICFSTKAVHLELVGDLTTDSFLAALKRFFARRGKSSDLYSNNAKTFVGADKELRAVRDCFKAFVKSSLIQRYTANNNITWHFIPPRAPHFGGLWESAVKSVKRHLLRTIGKTLLTYEAMVTYLSEIEAIMNSRPLTPVSSDPNDFTALTPGHFLIGDLITNINESSVTDIPANKLSIWQHVQRMREHFWTRWRKEYLHELTVRRKWHTSNPSEVKEGTLVIMHEDNLPALCWPLGRIIALHFGDDNVARVATIKTSAGEFKRALKKLSPLPIY